MPFEPVHPRVRNRPEPPTRNLNAAGSPPSASSDGAFTTLIGFRLTAICSSSDGGGAGFGADSSSCSRLADALVADGFSSLLASSDSSSGAGAASTLFPFVFAAGVLPFLPPFFFFASADSDTSSTSIATSHAMARTPVDRRGNNQPVRRGDGNDILIPHLPTL